jgi:hypothetical protein
MYIRAVEETGITTFDRRPGTIEGSCGSSHFLLSIQRPEYLFCYHLRIQKRSSTDAYLIKFLRPIDQINADVEVARGMSSSTQRSFQLNANTRKKGKIVDRITIAITALYYSY